MIFLVFVAGNDPVTCHFNEVFFTQDQKIWYHLIKLHQVQEKPETETLQNLSRDSDNRRLIGSSSTSTVSHNDWKTTKDKHIRKCAKCLIHICDSIVVCKVYYPQILHVSLGFRIIFLGAKYRNHTKKEVWLLWTQLCCKNLSIQAILVVLTSGSWDDPAWVAAWSPPLPRYVLYRWRDFSQNDQVWLERILIRETQLELNWH